MGPLTARSPAGIPAPACRERDPAIPRDWYCNCNFLKTSTATRLPDAERPQPAYFLVTPWRYQHVSLWNASSIFQFPRMPFLPSRLWPEQGAQGQAVMTLEEQTSTAVPSHRDSTDTRGTGCGEVAVWLMESGLVINRGGDPRLLRPH